MRLATLATLIAFALFATGCGGTQALGTGASDIVPATAPLFLAIDTDPGSAQWKTVDDVAGRFPDKQKGVNAVKKEMRDSGGLDWDKDVKPALGKEIDVVWLDLRNGGTDVVALMQPKDEQKFKAAVAKGNAHETSAPLVYDKFSGWEVMSDSRAKIRRFEQQSESASSPLADDPSFRHAMDTLGDAVARAYLNGPEVMNEARAAIGPQGEGFVRKLGTLEWAAAGLAATSNGVGLNVILHGTPGRLFKGVHLATYRSQLTETVPQDALLYYTFHGSGGLLGLSPKSPLLRAPQLAPLRGVLRQIGALVAGEDALYVRGAPSGRIPEVTLVTEPRPSVDGAVTLDHLLRRYRNEIGVLPRPTTIAGLPARTLRFGEFSVDYADVGRNLVITDSPRGIEAVANGGQTLAHSDTYRDAVSSAGMPSKTQGYLYVNVHSTIPVVERLAHAHVPARIRRNLAPLKSALEYEVARSHELEVSIFLRIK